MTTVRTLRPDTIDFSSVTVCAPRQFIFNIITSSFESEQFMDYLEFAYGSYKCFTFKSGRSLPNKTEPLLVQGDFGKQYGMLISMEIISSRDPGDNSAFLSIQDNSELAPYRVLSAYEVYAGQTTSTALKKTENKRLGKPYNDCFNNLDSSDSLDSNLYRLAFKNTYKYRRINCFEICAAADLSRECSCSTPGIFELPNTTEICDQSACIRDYLREYE